MPAASPSQAPKVRAGGALKGSALVPRVRRPTDLGRGGAVQREVLIRALRGKRHAHVSDEGFRKIFVALAVVANDGPYAQPRAQDVRDLVRQRTYEPGVRLDGPRRIPREGVVPYEEVIDGFDVKAPIAATRRDRLEARGKIVQGARRLAVQRHVPRQERYGRKVSGLRLRLREVLAAEESTVVIECPAACLIEYGQSTGAGCRLQRKRRGRAPFDDGHSAVRQPNRFSEALAWAREGVPWCRVGACGRRSLDERQRHDGGERQPAYTKPADRGWHERTLAQLAGWTVVPRRAQPCRKETRRTAPRGVRLVRGPLGLRIQRRCGLGGCRPIRRGTGPCVERDHAGVDVRTPARVPRPGELGRVPARVRVGRAGPTSSAEAPAAADYRRARAARRVRAAHGRVRAARPAVRISEVGAVVAASADAHSDRRGQEGRHKKSRHDHRTLGSRGPAGQPQGSEGADNVGHACSRWRRRSLDRDFFSLRDDLARSSAGQCT